MIEFRARKARATWVVAAAAVGAIAALMLVGTALGKDAGEITVAEGQTVEREYTPIPANEPEGQLLFGSFFRNPSRCKGDVGVAYCDAITLNIQRPAHYTSEAFFFIDIELTWNDPLNDNNLDLYVHQFDTEFQALASATTGKPEKIRLYDPPNNQYYIVVSNFRGVNAGYHLKVSFFPQEELSIFEIPDDFGGGGGQQSSVDEDESLDDPGFSELPLAAQTAAGSVGARLVERPGPDGPLSRRPLLLLAASTPPGANSRLPLIISSAVGFLAAAGLGIFLYLRGRHDSDF